MKVSALNIFFVKSIAATSVLEARAGERGFVGDRRLMVVDEDGRFLSQRTDALLGLISARPDGDSLRLRAPDRAELVVEAPQSRRPLAVRVWGGAFEVEATTKEADDWFSDYLGRAARLVYMPDDCVRTASTDVGGRERSVSFADGFPYLLASAASLEDLNGRSGPGGKGELAPVPMAAFRPNIVIEGAEPWAEDGWRRIRIGGAEFDLVEPCKRCVMTTLAPDDPRRVRGDGEPLRTLATFRRAADGGVSFGWNAVVRQPDTEVRVGDAVEVLA